MSESGASGARVRAVIELSDMLIEMRRGRLRRDHPGHTDAEIAGLLMKEMRVRPGAEYGDGEGVPGTWPRSPGPAA
jgi:hypothetical protein